MRSLIQDQLVVIFGAILIGGLIGQIRVRGLSLGNSACLFVAIAAGVLGASVDPIITKIGAVLFVYSVGLQAGPRFFNMFRARGIRFAFLGLIASAAAIVVAVLSKLILGFSAPLAAGVIAGAMTSTPSLAAAIDTIHSLSLTGVADASLGYAIAYPFGVVGVVLSVQILPRIWRKFRPHDAVTDEALKGPAIVDREFKITNANFEGKKFGELNLHSYARVNITRIRQGDSTNLIHPDTVMHVGDLIRAVGHEAELDKLATIVGEEVEKTLHQAAHIIAKDIFVSGRDVVGKSLAKLALVSRFGVVITRIRRNDIEFVPTASSVLDKGDLIRVVGDEETVKKFIAFAGAGEKTLDETNIMMLAGGLFLGILVGMIPIRIGNANFSLGLSGGPLFVALLFSHFGRIGPVNVRVPNAAKYILREFGLVLFLVGVGVSAGAGLPALQGWLVVKTFIAGILVTTLPLVATFVTAVLAFRMPIELSLGAVCGGMTSTPALGALTKHFDGPDGPTAYAAVYPVALISVVFFTQIFIMICRACI